MSSKSNISTTSLTEKTGVVVFAHYHYRSRFSFGYSCVNDCSQKKTDFAIMGYILMIHEVARNVALGFPDSVFYFFERITNTARRGFAKTITILMLSGAVAGLAILVQFFYT